MECAGTRTALLVFGMQIDHGALGTLGGVADRLAARIRDAASSFDLLVGVREWHPADHVSFAARHLWRKPGQQVETSSGIPVVLQPMHCVAHSFGARWLPPVDALRWSLVVDTGTRSEVDHYTAFEEADGRDTGLWRWLMHEGVDTLVLAGLPFEGMLGATFEQARAKGLRVRLLSGGCGRLHSAEAPQPFRSTPEWWWDV